MSISYTPKRNTKKPFAGRNGGWGGQHITSHQLTKRESVCVCVGGGEHAVDGK